ncbi:MAG: T9SS type A sorting domain-containing protein [Bacteroidales bacterium]|nr:T9SS type A sorting domain-containing protein [Bacteroidales bacterium]
MKRIAFLIALIALTISVNAQWTTNTTVNTEVSSFAGTDQDIETIELSDGSTAIVFWKTVAAPVNYELRLQVLNSAGVKQLGDTGVLISDSIPMSSYVNQWQLVRDENDNLYVGITATSNTAALAFKFDNQGNHLWPAGGVNLGVGFSIKILPLSSGNTAISWMSTSTYTSYIQLYNSVGAALWTSNTETWPSNVTIPGNLFELSNGDIVSVFHKKGTYSVNSTLYAQRFNTSGSSVWSSPTQLSTKTTVYNRIYSGAQSGDTVFFGYIGKQNNRFDACIQRINPDGTIPWGANGRDFDVNTTNYEMDVQIATEENSSNLWAMCTYTNTSQTAAGEYIQKIDIPTGNRLLSNTAKNLFPIGTNYTHANKLYVYNDRPFFLLEKGNNNGVSTTYLDVVMLDQVGNFAWADTSKAIASNVGTNKGQAKINAKIGNNSVVVFIENKGSGVNSIIYAQNFVDTLTLSNAAEIITYNLPTQDTSYIDASNDSIMVFMPMGIGYPVSLAANFSLSNYANSLVGSTVQDSSITNNTWSDSTTAVQYTVIAQNGSLRIWNVYVTARVVVSTAAEIIEYNLPSQLSSTIVNTNDSIIVYMPINTPYPITLAAEFLLSNNATAKVGGTVQDSAVTNNTWNDSIVPVMYEVTAEDGITTRIWKVYVVSPNNVGFNEIEKNNFKITYNNPIENELYINSEKTINNILVVDALGRTIYMQENISKNNFRVNTTKWKTGMYILIINNKYSYKVIKN